MATGPFDIAQAVEAVQGKYAGTVVPPQPDALTPPLDDPALTPVPLRPCGGT